MENMLGYFKNKIEGNKNLLIEENNNINKLIEEVNELRKKINVFVDEECELEKSRIFNIEVFIYSILVIIFIMTEVYINIDKISICLFSILNAIFVFGIGSKYVGDKEWIEKSVRKRLVKNYIYNNLNSQLLEKLNDIDFRREYIIRLNEEISYDNKMVEALERMSSDVTYENDFIDKREYKGKVRIKKINNK